MFDSKTLTDKKASPEFRNAADRPAFRERTVPARIAPRAFEIKPEREVLAFFADDESVIKEKITEPPKFEKLPDDKDIVKRPESDKFHWKPALAQSGLFLSIQHGARLMQKKTQRELDGPFFRDWWNSVKALRGWEDGDSRVINYIAHPLQGGVTGRIFINNSDKARRQEFGKSKAYWETRFKAFAWSTFWSTQFELGPFSEATIGNVGLQKKRGHSTMAYVDLVVTPVAGTGIVIAEDALDKYVLKNWLEKRSSKTMIKFFRVLFTPTTSFSNVLRGRMPWKRDDRLL